MLKLRKDESHKGYYLDQDDNLYVFRFGGRPIRVDNYREDKPRENVDADVAYVDKEDVIDHRKIASPKENKKFIEEANKEYEKNQKIIRDIEESGNRHEDDDSYDAYNELRLKTSNLGSEILRTERRNMEEEDSRIQPSINFDEKEDVDYVKEYNAIKEQEEYVNSLYDRNLINREEFDERRDSLSKDLDRLNNNYDEFKSDMLNVPGLNEEEQRRRDMMMQAEKDLSEEAYTELTDKTAAMEMTNDEIATEIEFLKGKEQRDKSKLDYRKERATEMYLDGDIDYDDLVSSYFSGDKDFADEYIEELKSPATKIEPDAVYEDNDRYNQDEDDFAKYNGKLNGIKKQAENLDMINAKLEELKDAPYNEKRDLLDIKSNAEAYNELKKSGETVFLDSEGNVLFKPQYYHKDYNRKIDLGIDLIEKGEKKGTTYRDILDSITGQMSDGIWENSPGMDKMWSNMDFQQLNDKVVMATPKEYYNWNNNWSRKNGWYEKSDEEVRNYLARKIKQIIKTEQEDGGIQGKWSRDNTEVSEYLTRNKPITVADAYELYDILKGRK